jgi:hypothetical protein
VDPPPPPSLVLSGHAASLAQENLWTVFNMFPHMYHTLTEVARARMSQVSVSACGIRDCARADVAR